MCGKALDPIGDSGVMGLKVAGYAAIVHATEVQTNCLVPQLIGVATFLGFWGVFGFVVLTTIALAACYRGSTLALMAGFFTIGAWVQS